MMTVMPMPKFVDFEDLNFPIIAYRNLLLRINELVARFRHHTVFCFSLNFTAPPHCRYCGDV